MGGILLGWVGYFLGRVGYFYGGWDTFKVGAILFRVGGILFREGGILFRVGGWEVGYIVSWVPSSKLIFCFFRYLCKSCLHGAQHPFPLIQSKKNRVSRGKGQLLLFKTFLQGKGVCQVYFGQGCCFIWFLIRLSPQRSGALQRILSVSSSPAHFFILLYLGLSDHLSSHRIQDAWTTLE